MKSILLFIFSLFISITLIGQQIITNEDGRKIKIMSDGTWKYVDEKDESERPTTYVYLNGKQLVSGGTSRIYAHDNYYSLGAGKSISVSIAKDGARTLIIFWRSRVKKTHMFPNKWTGTVTLFLEDGSTVKLIDRNLNGQNIIKDGFQGRHSYSSSDLSVDWSAYYLTPSECKQLKNSNLTRVAYGSSQQSRFGSSSTNIINVNINNDALKRQLIRI